MEGDVQMVHVDEAPTPSTVAGMLQALRDNTVDVSTAATLINQKLEKRRASFWNWIVGLDDED